MARFAFSMQASLAGLLGRSRVSGRTLRALCLPGTDDGLSGPGWYDSSHDLQRGLQVLEGLPSDTPLEDWLALWLNSAPTSPCRHPREPRTATPVPCPSGAEPCVQ
jgi:hypothetical protein